MSELQVDEVVTAEFQRALLGEDELGVVLRAHIHIEAELMRFIQENMVRPDSLDDMRLEYEQKLYLAVGLGLKKEFQGPLKALGKIRNKFAHAPNVTLRKDDVDNLVNAFRPDDRKVLLRAFETAKEQLGTGLGPQERFDSLPPKDRFIALAVVLKSALAVATWHVRYGVDNDKLPTENG